MGFEKGHKLAKGRPKGAKNKKTTEMLTEIAKTGEMPLEYMLRVMRDGLEPHDRRDDMAKAVAPYVHPKLASLEHKGEGGGPVVLQIVGQDAKLV